jgi:hypothetical protein
LGRINSDSISVSSPTGSHYIGRNAKSDREAARFGYVENKIIGSKRTVGGGASTKARLLRGFAHPTFTHSDTTDYAGEDSGSSVLAETVLVLFLPPSGRH